MHRDHDKATLMLTASKIPTKFLNMISAPLTPEISGVQNARPLD
jgi:hypothetical protein